MTDSKKFNPIYLLSILYVLYVYSFPFWFFEVKTDNALFYPIMLGVLIAFAFVETAVLLIFRKKLSDQTVYTAAIIIKYSLIPFYIISGNTIILMFLVPMMMGMWIILPITGWIMLACAAPFSVSAFNRQRKLHPESKKLCIAGMICQFFFCADVISLMAASFKMKYRRKATAAALIVALMIIGIIAALIIFGFAAGAVAIIVDTIKEKFAL